MRVGIKYILLLMICLIAIAGNLLSFTSYGQQLKIKDCFVDTKHGLKYCIASDTVTYDTTFGDSYRLLFISDSKNNTKVQSYYLDINTSPDFPYDLKADYLEEYGLLVIQGYASYYLYSSFHKKISKQIFPDYSNCNFSDRQGTMIHDLTITKNGAVMELGIRECGLRKFDIRNIEYIKEVE